MSLRPRLIIGIGGSGGKTIRAMKESLEFRLRQNQIDSLPSCWQFLQIDTTDDGLEFPAKMLPSSEKCIVVRPGQTFESIRESLEGKATNKEERNSFLAGWGIPYCDLDVTKGAGMIRGIGNQVGIAAAEIIYQSLDSALGKLFSGGVTNELTTIAQKMRHSQVKVETEPQVMIVSSLAGGSGAGMFIDVVEILKRISQFKDEAWISKGIISFLYTAEVFGTLKGAEDIKQNCLGAVNEITGGLLRPPTSRTDLLMQRLGVGPSGSDRIGTPINILIGSKNSAGVDIASGPNSYGMNEIFYTIGETLAALTLNPTLSEEFLNKSVTNVFNSPFKLTDTSGFAPRAADLIAPRAHPFAAVGFARLSVGADRVLEFVRDGLLRTQVESLIWPEAVGNAVLDSRMQTPEMMLEESIESQWPAYLSQSKISEMGIQNDVTDELANNETESLISRFVDDVVGNVAALTQPREISKVFPMLWSAYQSAMPEFERACEANIKKLAARWAESIQVYLTDYHAQKIAQLGLRVTSGLIRKMIVTELQKVTSEDLPGERKRAEAVLERADQSFLRGQLDKHSNGRQEIAGTDRQIIDAIRNDYKVVASKKEEVIRKKIAVELLLDLESSFLQPLEEMLNQRYRSLMTQYKSSDPIETQGIEFESLPDLIKNPKVVPPRYKPRAVEKTLISSEDYLNFYVESAEKDLPTNLWKNQGEVFKASQLNSLLGLPLKQDASNKKRQSLLVLSTNWRPKVTDVVNATAATFEMKYRFIDLRDANRDWLADPNSKFGETLKMNIRKYCTDGSLDQNTARQERFVKEYSEMLTLSAPLANYAKGAFKVLSARGSESLSSQFEVSVDPIPFDKTDPNVGQRLDAVVTAFLQNSGTQVGVDDTYARKWFDPSSTAKELFVLQLPLASLPAYAFGSLTNPIMDSLMSAAKSDDWKDYWISRRTRPLAESIPVGRAPMQSIITGYYIAKMFGMIDFVDEKLKGTNFQQIASPALDGKYTKFPQPMLQVPLDSGRGLFLPSILMSLGLAFVNFGQTGDEQHLHAHRLLQCLGREVTTTVSETGWKDQWNNSAKGDLLIDGIEIKSTLLRDWILTGRLQGMSEFTPSEKVGSATGSIENRREAVVSYLDNQIQQWAAQWERLRTAEWYELPNVWEIREEIDKALRYIRDYAKSIQVDSGANGSSELDG